jgi:hypothetical protein
LHLQRHGKQQRKHDSHEGPEGGADWPAAANPRSEAHAVELPILMVS